MNAALTHEAGPVSPGARQVEPRSAAETQGPLAIRLVDIRKDYDLAGEPLHVLKGIDLEVPEGDYIAIMGPSGSGKSTLLNLLGCLDKPTSGEFHLGDQDVSQLKDDALAHIRASRIGFVFQSFHLLPTFTVSENVQIPMFETGLSRGEREVRAHELLVSVGLSHRLKHFPSELSGGERQRVAIARSLANRPSVLLADEPTGNLDSENAAHVVELLLKLHQELGMTLVLVTHDLGIAALATRTIRMKDGRVVDETTPLTHAS